MGFNEILSAVQKLSSEEISLLKNEIEKIEVSYVNHGISDDQWLSIKRTQEQINSGTMSTRPARTVLTEIIERLK